MLIEGAERLQDTDWFVSTISIPAFTIHAVFDQSNPAIGFGILGDFNSKFAVSLIDALESVTLPEHSGDVVTLPHSVGQFDTLGVVRGPERQFLRGWSDDSIDVIHVVPLFPCELTPEGKMQPFEEFKRKTDVFDVNRNPEPFFVFQMQGGKSQLSVEPWGSGTCRELDIYITILSGEPESRLIVRNRHGRELAFPQDSGWDNAHQEIHDFLVET
ncbi:MAG: hypothetical protein KDA84_14170 [Planctomycetaceae bacterium]|nr:hypothetical protein [Planctomycetaceae bacterium]